MAATHEEISGFLLRRGLVAFQGLTEGLTAWRSQRAEGLTLAHVLIERGSLDAEALSRALLDEGLALFACSGCGRSLGAAPSALEECDACRRPLIPVGLASLAASASAGVAARRMAGDEPLRPGDQLGGYRVRDTLATGGACEVYLATDPSGERVALKVLAPDAPERALRRLAREFDVLEALVHPHVLRPLEVQLERRPAFLALEYVDGQTFDGLLASAPPLEVALDVLEVSAAGVAAAHELGIVHRDLKPGNILIDRQGFAKVADFGLAKIGGSRLTGTGAALGTPQYMAPELIDGAERATVRVDVYALGVMLYRVLTGVLPFEGASLPEVFHRTTSADVPSPRELDPDIPPALASVCERATRRDADRRYADAGAWLAALRRARRGVWSSR